MWIDTGLGIIDLPYGLCRPVYLQLFPVLYKKPVALSYAVRDSYSDYKKTALLYFIIIFLSEEMLLGNGFVSNGYFFLRERAVRLFGLQHIVGCNQAIILKENNRISLLVSRK